MMTGRYSNVLDAFESLPVSYYRIDILFILCLYYAVNARKGSSVNLLS